jgi:phosphate transport system substrate-binding protein
MSKKFITAVATAAVISSVAFSGPAAFAKSTISETGSTFAKGILTACAAAYTTDTVNVDPAAGGSGAGRTAFKNDSVDFAASDTATSSNISGAIGSKGLVVAPIVGGPVAIPFNLKGKNDAAITNLQLDAATLTGIFTGDITKWNDSAIQAINPSVKANLPTTTITVAYRGSSSGTTQNFLDYLKQKTNSAKITVGSTFASAITGGAPAGGYAAADSGALATYVDNNNGSIGYVDLKDAKAHPTPWASVKNNVGVYVQPTVPRSAAFLAAQTVTANGSVTLDFTKKVVGGYDISLITYAYAPTSAGTKGTAVKKFLTYLVNTCAPSKAAGLGYVALTGGIKTAAQAKINTIG